MAQKNNTAEGQAPGTTLTAANSGGGSGDAFSSVARGTGATLIYTNADTVHGTQCYAYTGGSTSTFVAWTGFSDTQIVARVYVKFVNTIPAANTRIIDVRNSTGSAASVFVNSTGKLMVQDTTGTKYTAAITLQTGQWYRIEIAVSQSATVATLNVDYYVAGSATPVEAGCAISNANTGSAVFTEVRFISDSTTTYTDLTYFADFAVNNATLTYIGRAPTPSFSSVATALAVAFDASASTANASGATISSYAWDFGDGGTGTGATPSHTYAAQNTYTVTLTLTDSHGNKNRLQQAVTALAPSQNFTVLSVLTSTGWTPSAGTVLACLSDGDLSTYVTSSNNPVALPLKVKMSPGLAPAAGVGLTVPIPIERSADSSTASITAKLYDSDGTTLRSTVSGVAVTGVASGGAVNAGNVAKVVFPAVDVVNVTDWSGVVIEIDATAA